MINWEVDRTEWTEDVARRILVKCGLDIFRNNGSEVTKTDVDLKTTSGYKMDVQFSQNYLTRKFFYMDLISAYFKKPAEKTYKDSLLNEYQHKYKANITKVGKWHNGDYLDAVTVLYYDDKLEYADIRNDTVDAYPSHLLIIKKANLMKYYHKYVKLSQCRPNYKDKLGDTWESAFASISLNHLLDNCSCVFDTPKNIMNNTDIVNNYLQWDTEEVD